MSNKKVFKEMYEEKLNEEKNKEKILERVNKDGNFKIQSYLKWSIVPLCLLLVVCLIINESNNNLSKFEDSNQKDNNIINFNEVVYEDNFLDIGGRYEERTYDELSESFNFLKKIDISYNEMRLIERYATDDKTLAQYNNTIGYEVFYTLDDDKYIELFFSKTLKENPKCVVIPDDSMKDSKIGGVEMKVLNYKNNFNTGYEAFFKLDDLYFDVEFTNVSEKEFVSFIESLVK